MKMFKETLEMDIKLFVYSLPYWAKYLASKILAGNTISEDDIETSYSYLLEELQINEETEKPEIKINYNIQKVDDFKENLILSKLENIEGVNALVEKQSIVFIPNLTIIYGENGSGKSGYIRLLKKSFYSKAPEEILPNIHLDNGHKPVNAKFTFKSNDKEIPLAYSENNKPEFEQFAVFDGKGLFKQLSEKNEFEFRPAGLSFFANYTNAIVSVEQKLNSEITTKKMGNTAKDLSDLFDGDSEIKSVVTNLNAQTKLDDLKKFIPFSSEDKELKSKIQKQYDELLLASKGKEKLLKDLIKLKDLLTQNKNSIKKLNSFFSKMTLEKVNDVIKDCLAKEETARAEGIENFKTDKIDGIGSVEWKNFIIAAEEFAKKQKLEIEKYPQNGDFCLLCQQPLSDDSNKLITKYWDFIKSVAEENARKSQETLEKVKQAYEKLNFDLFPDNNMLTAWLIEKYPEELKELKQKLSELETLSINIISNIRHKRANDTTETKISIENHSTIESAINTTIKTLQEDEQSKELDRLQKAKILLVHKEKFNLHFSKFEAFIKDQAWIQKAGESNFAKRKITETEKTLSEKYFNQKYIEIFNEECQKLNGNFGIDINHTGSAGRSYKQLKIKGINPNSVLSEGEQKVIAIADFISEMQLSEINKGIIFDDPVNSLDERRKSDIAKRLVEEAKIKQTIIFTHDLVFLSSLIGYSTDLNVNHCCHWIENQNGNPGVIWLNNSPSYEKKYRNAEPAKQYYNQAKKETCPPMQRESLLKYGFTALRTSYEVIVINDLFKNVVQRFNERVSVDSLSSVYFDTQVVDDLLDSFAQCCRYMEGHSHSDKYAYKKPEVSNLNEEIQRFEEIRRKVRKIKRPSP